MRKSLLSHRDSLEAPEVTYTIHGQQEILDSINAHKKEGQLLNFIKINDYILGFKGELKEEFCAEVAQMILDHYRANGHAIACFAHILTQSDESGWLSRIDGLKEKS